MRKKREVLCCAMLMLLASLGVIAQDKKQKWVDSVFQTLNQNERIGQLLVTRISSHVQADFQKDIQRQASSGHFGGIVFTTGTASKQLRLTRQLQGAAKVPLLISQDASAGLGHLLDSALDYPHPLAQGAFADDSLIYWIARESGEQLKTMGVHMSLSPNGTPVHSGTTNTSAHFSDRVSVVDRKSLLHMKSLQDAGVLS